MQVWQHQLLDSGFAYFQCRVQLLLLSLFCTRVDIVRSVTGVWQAYDFLRREGTTALKSPGIENICRTPPGSQLAVHYKYQIPLLVKCLTCPRYIWSTCCSASTLLWCAQVPVELFGLNPVHWAAAGSVGCWCKPWSPVSFLALCWHMSQLFSRGRNKRKVQAWNFTALFLKAEWLNMRSFMDQTVILGFIGCGSETCMLNAMCVRKWLKFIISHKICKMKKHVVFF